ncbi:LysE family translocator [Agromyces sp. M3QZ16-3]|uniref:LysE family translocator n=1 Tax=Agromyces sp. M3QZ16-3 TaxID=3447585 RepID=UPI003F68D36A
MPFSLWITLLAACFAISFTPGAGAINTMGNALSHGFRRSIWGILGQQAALVVHIAIVALGVGVLVANSPVTFEVIRYAGAAYLVYLGVRQILRKPVDPGEDDEPDEPDVDSVDGPNAATSPPPAESRWSMFRRGMWVNLLNPKAIVFFLAFLPQFIRPDLPLPPQYAIVAATVVAVDVIVMWGFFAIAAHGMRRFTRSRRGQRTIDVTFGVLFIAIGGLLAFVH